MPEGHTIHRYAREHHALLGGKRVRVSSPQGRFEAEAAELTGRKPRRVEAWGKHLFYHWAGGNVVHVHLGLAGRFAVHESPAPEAHPLTRIRIEGKDHTVDLKGPMICELVRQKQVSDILARLGPDPIRDDADPSAAYAKIRRTKRSLASLLMDQSVIAGIGNIYRCELLFIHRLAPSRPGMSLSENEFEALWETLVRLMRVGLETGRIKTVSVIEPALRGGRVNKHGERLYVYKQPDCLVCGAPVESWKVDGRMVYACPACQR